MIPQATASSNQAPGLVVRGSKPFVELVFKGHPNLARELEKSRKLREELTALLTSGGFGGTFMVIAQTTAKGTAHTKGLHIHSPGRHGAVLTWHEKSNDQCIQFAVSTPSAMNAMDFHTRLKKADCGYDEEEPVMNGAAIDLRQPTQPPARQAPVIALVSTTSAPQQPTKEGAGADNVLPYQRFVDDTSNVELLMLELVKSASPNGWVRRSTCVLVLRDGGFGFGRHGTGPVLRSIVTRGHLHEISSNQDHYRISDTWLAKLRPEQKEERVPPSAPRAAPAESAAPPAIQEERVTAPAVEIRQPPSLGTDVQSGAAKGKLTDVIAELSLKAKAAERWQAELNEIEAEIASITQSRDVLNQRLARVETKRESLKRNLARPDIVSARETLERVNSALEGR